MVTFISILLTACAQFSNLRLQGSPGTYSMEETCQPVIEGMNRLNSSEDIPQHLTQYASYYEPGDFDPNEYFTVLDHLHMRSGETLDYLYHYSDMGGYPMVYNRAINRTPFRSINELYDSLSTTEEDETYNEALYPPTLYMHAVEVDKSPESYFQYISLATLGEQFYLYWHANYNDNTILCEKSDLNLISQDLANFLSLSLPEETLQKAAQIDFTPTVTINANDVVVRWVEFTKWGGFLEKKVTLSKDNPIKILAGEVTTLVEYDCEVAF
jgi:hypothetical protein